MLFSSQVLLTGFVLRLFGFTQVVHALLEHEVRQIISDFRDDLLTIVALEDWLIFVQRVARKMIEVSERVLAFEKPVDFEVRLEIKMVRIIVVILIVGLTPVLMEELRLVVLVGLAFHSGDALETAGFSQREEQNDVVTILEGLSKFLCWGIGGSPDTVLLRCL